MWGYCLCTYEYLYKTSFFSCTDVTTKMLINSKMDKKALVYSHNTIQCDYPMEYCK